MTESTNRKKIFCCSVTLMTFAGLGAGLTRWLSRFLQIEVQTLGQFVRFGIVGGAASLTYAVVVYFLMTYTQIGAVVSSSVAYLVAIPVSFVGQKYFTFGSIGKVSDEAPRFATVQLANILLCGAVMAAFSDGLGLAPIYGIVAVIVLVPIVSYVLFTRLVFRCGE